jgi:hypothetical protein
VDGRQGINGIADPSVVGLRQRGQIAFFTHQIRKRKKEDTQLARSIDAVIEYYEKSELTPFF